MVERTTNQLMDDLISGYARCGWSGAIAPELQLANALREARAVLKTCADNLEATVRNAPLHPDVVNHTMEVAAGLLRAQLKKWDEHE